MCVKFSLFVALAGVAQLVATGMGPAPSWAHARGNRWMFLSHINVSLPLFSFSLPPLLSRLNKRKKNVLKN